MLDCRLLRHFIPRNDRSGRHNDEVVCFPSLRDSTCGIVAIYNLINQ
ncbi:hypothetical protein [Helicobacter rodentium]|nr:hypothetical protein [Helicobacter rodentium]